MKELIDIRNSICYIVGACQELENNIYILNNNNDLVIAADGGYDSLIKKNIIPDIVLGDFDSVSSMPEHKSIIKYPIKKDETDTFLSYKAGSDRGYEYFVIYGGIGGRIDHTIANIQMLSYIAENKGRGFLVGDGAIITAIHNSFIEFPKDYTGKISVFSAKNTSKNVEITGLGYSAENILLNSSFPLGVSNEFIGERAKISVGEGTLLVVWYEKPESFIHNIDSFLNL